MRLAPRDRGRAVRALGWLLLASAALRILPFATVRRWMERVPPARSARASLSGPECALAIARATVVFPRARCLARALAASGLLRRAGRASTLHLGAGFDGDRRFEAHAWLECDGLLVTGGDVADRYVSFEARAARDA